jgi:hypothetical protein
MVKRELHCEGPLNPLQSYVVEIGPYGGDGGDLVVYCDSCGDEVFRANHVPGHSKPWDFSLFVTALLGSVEEHEEAHRNEGRERA